MPNTFTKGSIRHKLNVIIFGTDTTAGKAFDIILIIAILSSLLVLILETVPSIYVRFPKSLKMIEYSFTALFTIEYLLRLYCSSKPRVYAKSFYGVIDLLAILPTYLSLLLPGTSAIGVIRGLRVLRIFRVLKLVRYLDDSNMLLKSLLFAKRKILIFFATVAILVTILASLIFVVEGPTNGFTSIPTSIYWAIVTITTVGYGDLIPQTPLGQFIASITMLLGYSIIAVPTGIITAELNNEMKVQRQKVTCPSPECGETGHEKDSDYCRRCGTPLAHEDSFSGKALPKVDSPETQAPFQRTKGTTDQANTKTTDTDKNAN